LWSFFVPPLLLVLLLLKQLVWKSKLPPLAAHLQNSQRERDRDTETEKAAKFWFWQVFKLDVGEICSTSLEFDEEENNHQLISSSFLLSFVVTEGLQLVSDSDE
jgi:hypothetical protein